MITFDFVQLLAHLFVYKKNIHSSDLINLRKYLLIELRESERYKNAHYVFDLSELKREAKYFPNHIQIVNDEFIQKKSLNPNYFKEKNVELHEIIKEATYQWAEFNNLVPLRQSQ